MELGVQMRLVVEAIGIHGIAEILLRSPRVVGTDRRQPGRIQLVADFGEPVCDPVLVRITLFRNLVADAPHYH